MHEATCFSDCIWGSDCGSLVDDHRLDSERVYHVLHFYDVSVALYLILISIHIEAN